MSLPAVGMGWQRMGRPSCDSKILLQARMSSAVFGDASPR